MALPPGFTDMARELLNDEADDFLRAMERPPVCSIRLNSRKPGASFPDAIPVKWCPTGFYLPERPVFTLDPLLHAGAYYVQDASSMIYREVADRIAHELAPGKPLTVLEMCAAPGGKTTAMIDALPDGSRIVANEYVGRRAGILRENLTKWGYPDVSVTNRDSAFFAEAGNSFDIVAVDAPCSGEGMMRKDQDAVRQWSMKLVESCAELQREILRNAVRAVKPGGYLIYSTCTFNRLENEDNALFIKEELGMNPCDLQFPEEWGIPRGIGTDLPVWRFMPHRTEGEGLFLAVFSRPGEYEPTQHTNHISPVKKSSLPCKKGGDNKGGHNNKGGEKKVEAAPIEEILSTSYDRNRFPECELSEIMAIAYLRRESITLPPDVPKGIVTVTYKGLPLGQVKNIGSRANNLYPKSWRILMQA